MSDQQHVAAPDTLRAEQSPPPRSEASNYSTDMSGLVIENITVGKDALNCQVSTGAEVRRLVNIKIEDAATNIQGRMSDQSIQSLKAGRDVNSITAESVDTQNADTQSGAEVSTFDRYGPPNILSQ
jgi:hypothetical protein